MHQVITAIFEDGMLKPEGEIRLPPQTRVRITLEPITAESAGVSEAWESWERLCEDSPVHSTAERLSRDQLHERD